MADKCVCTRVGGSLTTITLKVRTAGPYKEEQAAMAQFNATPAFPFTVGPHLRVVEHATFAQCLNCYRQVCLDTGFPRQDEEWASYTKLTRRPVNGKCKLCMVASTAFPQYSWSELVAKSLCDMGCKKSFLAARA
eukprot:6491934-Amphidinium_carterae.1